MKKIWDKLTLLSKITFVFWTFVALNALFSDKTYTNFFQWISTCLFGYILLVGIAQLISKRKHTSTHNNKSLNQNTNKPTTYNENMSTQSDDIVSIPNNPSPMPLNRSIYGISPEEIALLEYASEHDSDISTFSKKYYYDYGLDYNNTMSFLIENNYIRIGDAKESLDLYNVQDLKNFLRELGLPLSGNKTALIQRIIENSTEYDKQFVRRKFILTNKGENVIDKYNSDHNIPKTEKEKLDRQFAECSQQVQKHLQEGNLGLYACDLYSMSEVYRKEHCYNDQLEVLMISAYIHLSGIDTIKEFNWAISNHFKYTGLHPMLPPAVLRGIKNAMKNLNMDIPAFQDRFREKIDLTLTPGHIFGKNKALKIICLYLENEFEQAEEEIEKGEKEFISRFKKEEA